MAVGFKVDFFWYQIGSGDFLHSFFLQWLLIWRMGNGESVFLLS